MLNNHLYSIQQQNETAVIVYLRENYRSKQRAKVNEFNLKVAKELGIAGKLVQSNQQHYLLFSVKFANETALKEFHKNILSL